MENALMNENRFNVVGRLISADVKFGNRPSDGSGYVTVDALVLSVIDGEENEYPISFFASELTKDGKHSKLYDTYAKMPEIISKKVDVSGSIRENRYWSANSNQLVSSQQLAGTWIKTTTENQADMGSFELGGFVGGAVQEKRNKSDEIYRYDLVLGQVNFKGDNMSRFVVHINPNNHEVLSAVQSLYEVGDTIKISGDLKFITKEDVVTEETGFGKPITKTFKNKQRNFYITAGNYPITDENAAYSLEKIKELKAAYDARDVELMNAQKAAPAPVATAPTPITKRQASLI